MNREQRREQLRDWRKLSQRDRALAALMGGPQAIPEQERGNWLFPDDDQEPVGCPECGRP